MGLFVFYEVIMDSRTKKEIEAKLEMSRRLTEKYRNHAHKNLMIRVVTALLSQAEGLLNEGA